MTSPKCNSEECKTLKLVAQGDEIAFRILFDQYHQKLGVYIFRITRSQVLSEDIVQDIFMKIWINRAALVDVQNFQSYLFVISRNYAFNCLKNKAQQSIIFDEMDSRHEEIGMELSDDLEARYQLIDEAIDCLPVQQRKVYMLSRHERLKYGEIALKLNISKETVKKYLQIAGNSIAVYIRNKSLIPNLIYCVLFF